MAFNFGVSFIVKFIFEVAIALCSQMEAGKTFEYIFLKMNLVVSWRKVLFTNI